MSRVCAAQSPALWGASATDPAALEPAKSESMRQALAADGAAAKRLEAWINPGLYSRHFDRDLTLRENNYGAGVELVSGREHGVMLGVYRNSNDRHTRYVGYIWRPLQWGPDDGLRAGAGVIVAAFDGYPLMRDGGWFPALLPVVSVEYKRVGVNFTIVPGYKDRLHGAIAVQAKLRVW